MAAGGVAIGGAAMTSGLRRPADLGLASLVYANYCQMWREVGDLASDDSIFTVQQRQEALLVRSNSVHRVPHMILDPTVRDAHARAWTAEVVRELTTGSVSLMAGIPPASEESALVAALRAEGFLPAARPQIAMARLDLSPGLAAEDAAICLARSAAELAEARAVLARVFGLPGAVFAFYTPPSIVRTYLLRQHGSPVGAACLCPFAGVAGIYSVGVLPAARGRGVAGRLVRRALEDAALDGFATAVLSCERQLVPLYQRLGFNPCWEQTSYWLDAWWR